jgi:hypothetical protein
VETLQPLINLLIVLTVLSMVAERVTNILKLDNPELRVRRTNGSEDDEKKREGGITWRSLIVGVVVALVVKANIFEILVSLDAPWETLGWVRLDGSVWERVPATASVGTALYAAGGSALTGLGLSFGSKFWHEFLDAILEIRNIIKRIRQEAPLAKPETATDGGLNDE